MRLSIYLTSSLVPVVLGQSDPGFPVKNPSISYWQIPPHPNVADHQSQKLPESADIVIIGSGISGTSIAWHLLMHNNDNSTKVPNIAMLEARRACSGATGRNGGHIRPSSYEEYELAKQIVTREEAVKVTKLRAHHVDALIRAADRLPEQGKKAASARPVDSLDVYFEEAEFAEAVRQWETLKKELPEIGNEWGVLQRDEAVRISLMPGAVGALTGTAKVAGAIWPYRFVTHGLEMLLKTYPSSFSLDTHTTATAVKALECSTHSFEVETDRGTILANHVVHASNAWAPHFVPSLGNTLSGGLLSMSAQLGGAGLPKPGEWPAYHNNVSLPGGRAWTLFVRGSLDYVVQNPEHGEYMFGGGAGIPRPTSDTGGAYNDSQAPAPMIAAYLDGALPTYFGYENWGAERTDFPSHLHPDIYPGRTKRVWTGVEGFTKDELPLVGPLSERLTNRTVAKRPAAGREWVSAGFNGEGMDYAWLSGRALSEMIRSDMAPHVEKKNESVFDWFPKAFLPTEERVLRKQNSTAVARRSLGRTKRLGPSQ